MIAAAGGFITAIVGLLTFMSVPAPSIVVFDASPNIISVGESSILKWSVTGDEATVNIVPDIGIVGLSGTREVAPNITTNYTLTAKNGDKEKTASVQLIVREKKEDTRDFIYETLPPAAEPADSFESADINEPRMRQNEIDAPVSAIVQDIAPKFNASESPAHNESGLTESSKISDDGVTEQKAAKVITAADWALLNNGSRSENDFASSAPIHAKLRDTRHTPANSPDFQEPAVSDPGFAGSDYLGTDIQS